MKDLQNIARKPLKGDTHALYIYIYIYTYNQFKSILCYIEHGIVPKTKDFYNKNMEN